MLGLAVNCVASIKLAREARLLKENQYDGFTRSLSNHSNIVKGSTVTAGTCYIATLYPKIK